MLMKEMKQTPLSERYMLTVREAADYFGIGEHKLRDILDKNPEKNLSAWNGNRQLILLFNKNKLKSKHEK